jgi:hypothetical protein
MREDFLVAVGLVVVGWLYATACHGQAVPLAGSANAIIQNRRDANATALQRRAESEAQGLLRAAQEEPQMSLSVGFGYENGEKGARSTTVPVAFDYAVGGWYLVAGGGVGSARSKSGHDLGWSDVTIGASYTFTSGDPRWQLTTTLSVLVPARGEVGSKRSVQSADVELSFKPDEHWKLYADVSLAHDDESVEGVCRYSRGASVKAEYYRTTATFGSLTLQRSLTRGDRGTTSSDLAFNFPVPRSALSGLVLLSRTWTSGRRSTGLELDVSYAF